MANSHTVSNMPLAGLKVITFEQAVAMPLCSRHLADLGADVIKVERREGDFARAYDSAVHGTSTWFTWLNRGKRSLTLDMKLAEGRGVAERLVQGADVVLQNFAPGAFDRLGLGVAQLHERYPRLIAVSLTGYGEDGPYRDRKAYDLLLQAEAGVLDITGNGEQPAKAAVSVVDLSAGMYAFGAITAALYRRDRSGEGAAIRVSLFDAITEWMSPFLLMAEHGPKPQRAGARHNSIVPYGPYRVAGGRHVVFAVQNEAEWRRFCTDVIERLDLAEDPRFRENQLRLRHRETLEAAIEDALAGLDAETVEGRLERAGVAYSRMNEVTDVLHHPQVVARNRLIEVGLPGGMTAEVLRSPFNIEGVEEAASAVPAPGEHTEEVLEELGYGIEEIGHLRSLGAI